LSVAILVLAAQGLNQSAPENSLDWLLSHTYDPSDGGVNDTLESGEEKYSNVAGFTIAGLLGFSAFAE
jgi:hypothetical protein